MFVDPGTPEEQELLSEKVRILNERDDLIRREDYYNILESIGDVTARFSDVQHELGALIAIEGARCFTCMYVIFVYL